jgi:hypothetical protein
MCHRVVLWRDDDDGPQPVECCVAQVTESLFEVRVTRGTIVLFAESFQDIALLVQRAADLQAVPPGR